MSTQYISSHYGPSHYESSHFGREVVIELPPEVVHPPGASRRKQIRDEDEVILAIIVAFLDMKGR